MSWNKSIPILVGALSGIVFVSIIIRFGYLDQFSTSLDRLYQESTSNNSSSYLSFINSNQQALNQSISTITSLLHQLNKDDSVKSELLSRTTQAQKLLLEVQSMLVDHITLGNSSSNSLLKDSAGLSYDSISRITKQSSNHSISQNIESTIDTSLTSASSANINIETSNSRNVISTNRGTKTKCPYNFKVFVYPVVPSLPSFRYSEEARRNKTLHICQKCIFEQFSLEYILYDFFTQFCGRTYNPDEADYFYMPIIRDAEYRINLQVNNRESSSTELALLDIIENQNHAKWSELFQYTDKYWKAKNGFDHIIVIPAPVTNLRHESSRRGFFHYMMHLSEPIFLALEYSASFLQEYPFCTARKNILMPYPSTDPDLFSSRLFDKSIEKTALIFYWGGMHGDCVEVRTAMKQIMNNCSRVKEQNLQLVPPAKLTQHVRENGFRASKFCPIPIGDSPSSKRMYDVMHFGCIPVVLSDDLAWAYVSTTGGRLNQSSFSIQLPQAVVHYTAEFLLNRYANHTRDFGVLPSGVLIYDLLLQSQREGGEYVGRHYMNPLVQILLRIPVDDVLSLQRGVEFAGMSDFNHHFYIVVLIYMYLCLILNL